MIKKIFVPLLLALALFVNFAPVALAADTTKCAIQRGVNLAAQGANDCKATTSAGDLNGLIKSIINILSVLVGAAAVIMIIIGGFRYVTSAGSDTGVQAAKKTILYAIVGLIIVALAQVIVHFVLKSVT
jgi:hypothetical protein